MLKQLRRWWPAASVGVGAVILVVVGSFASTSNASSPPHDFGALPAQALPAQQHRSPTSDATDQASASLPSQSSDSAAPPVQSPTPAPTAVRSSGGSRRTAPTPAVNAVGDPVTLGIPSQNVQAPVDVIWATQGNLLPPTDPSRVGWWRASALPGTATGTTVLVGHVDSAQFGPGALFTATKLLSGDTLTIRSAAATIAYRVTARRTLDKTLGLPTSLFASDGPSTLVVITCGGPFNTETRHYRDNVIITATQIAIR